MELDELLISQVQKYEHISNKTDSLFKKTGAKEKAWESVAEAVNWDGKFDDLNLMCKIPYTQEKRLKANESVSGSGASKRPEWALYQQLGFLDRHVLSRKSISNYHHLNETQESVSIAPYLTSYIDNMTVIEMRITPLEIDIEYMDEVLSPGMSDSVKDLLSPTPSTSRDGMLSPGLSQNENPILSSRSSSTSRPASNASMETTRQQAGHLASRSRCNKRKAPFSTATENIEKCLGEAFKEMGSLNRADDKDMEDEDFCFGHTKGLLLKKQTKKNKKQIRINILQLFDSDSD
ncbi:hypothetical protein ABEB36_014777 [Hypothenemus hampei]|uniref:MADF domain-containing protein n=1 Tax=Hypothenemus hampei TaxID=57062 RepID=A0ABD1E335_HYPHA